MYSANGHGHYFGASSSYRSQPRTSVLVKIINDSRKGCLNLEEIKYNLGLSMNKAPDLGNIWEVLNDNKDNFIIDKPNKRASQLNGRESVHVFTKLTLCETHCRKATKGRNRNCSGRCEALHLCRTFLLCSQDACPFSKQRNCMFGHNFHSPHNAPLLKEHNLDELDDDELRRLFRRPSSRSKTTMPQICIYYNNVKGKRCANEKCKSLHLCSDFIEDQCFEDCPQSHNLSDKRVTKILDIFGIDSMWSRPLLLEHLQKLSISRHQAVSRDEDLSCFKGIDYNNLRPPSLQNAANGTNSKRKRKSSLGEGEDIYLSTSDNKMSRSSSCTGCTKLQQEVEHLKKDMCSVMTDIQELKQKDKKNTTHKANDSGNSSTELTLSEHL